MLQLGTFINGPKTTVAQSRYTTIYKYNKTPLDLFQSSFYKDDDPTYCDSSKHGYFDGAHGIYYIRLYRSISHDIIIDRSMHFCRIVCCEWSHIH